MLPAAGILCSVAGYFAVSTDEQDPRGAAVELRPLIRALNRGMHLAATLFAICAYLITCELLGLHWRVFVAVIVGLLAGVAIGRITEYYTSFDFGPVQSIKDRATTGPATVVIQGLGVGKRSTVSNHPEPEASTRLPNPQP